MMLDWILYWISICKHILYELFVCFFYIYCSILYYYKLNAILVFVLFRDHNSCSPSEGAIDRHISQRALSPHTQGTQCMEICSLPHLNP